MKPRPLILISPSVEPTGIEFSDLSLSLSIRYLEAVARCGGLPLVLPHTHDRKLLADYVARADGVLLTGGEDLEPKLYAESLPARVRKKVIVTPDGGRRDYAELLLIDEVLRQRKPLLAICRGHQLLNVALGGTLFADLALQKPDALDHRRMDKKSAAVHDVGVTPGSLLARLVRRPSFGVNSTHHQGVDAVPGVLRPVATSSDGLVEALELQPAHAVVSPFLLSVQFHPERLLALPAHRAILHGFVRACQPHGTVTLAD